VSSRSASSATTTSSPAAGGGSDRACGVPASRSAPIAAARCSLPAKARPPTTTGEPGGVRRRYASCGPDEMGGHRARQREDVDVTGLEPLLQVVRRHGGAQHGDVGAGFCGEGGGHAGRQGVPLALRAGQGDARTVTELPARRHHPQRRHGGLGDGRGRVLVRDRPLAPLPELPDARLRRRQDLLDDLAQRRPGVQQVHDEVRRGGRVAAHERVEVAVER
jgi:hypothetical protein